MRILNLTWFVPVVSLIACQGDAERTAPIVTTGDGYLLEGELPAGVDLDQLLAQLPQGGFGIVADPGTGEVATLVSTSSPFARVASGEFSVAVAASCTDCGDPTCASTSRTIAIGLRQDSGPSGETYEVQTVGGTNFSSPVTTPSSWTSNVGSVQNVSTTGTLPTCAPFSHFFDVIGEPAPDTGDPPDPCDPFDTSCTVQLYAQNFDSLPSSGNGVKDDFLDALPGWNFHHSGTRYDAGTGSSNTGAMYSFGATGDSERALGAVASGGTGTLFWGFCYENTLGYPVSDVTVQYTGEQWRNGGNETAQALRVDVSVADSVASGLFGAAFTATPTGDPATGWSTVSALAFTGPVATATAGALDGNAAANRTLIHELAYGGVLEPGDSVCVRWVDLNDAGNDHGLASDDLVLRAVPHP